MKIQETLEAVRNANGIKTDGELARFVGLDKRRISDYLSGKREPTSDDYAKIAAAAGINAGSLWEAVQKERATDETTRKAWDNYMKRLGGLAASVAESLLLVVTLIVTPHPAEAAVTPFAYENSHGIQIMRLIALKKNP